MFIEWMKKLFGCESETIEPIIDEYDNKSWYNERGQLHRINGPAEILACCGCKHWYINGKRHREGGPAVIECDGKKVWYINGELHREGAPAIEYKNEDKRWYVNGRLHRSDGPAVEYSTGYKEWWYTGRRIDCGTQEEFECMIRLELFW